MLTTPEAQELQALLRARFPIILIESHEEPRALALLEQVANLEEQALFRWSLTDGMRRVGKDETMPQTQELTAALRHVDFTMQNGVYVFCDAHPFLDNPLNIRLLREIALDHVKNARTLVLISPRLQLPSELLRLSAHLHMVLPDRTAIKNILVSEAKMWHGLTRDKVRGEQGLVDRLITHLQGLEEEDVKRLVRQIIRDDGEISEDDLRRVLRLKHECMGGAGSLSFEHSTAQFSDVGGLNALKHWLGLRREVFIKSDANAVDRPKGILLLGVQGGGKSLAARAVAGQWGLPLMRLDFAALYNKFYGETERNLRNALDSAEGMAPCVLWIDELEKGIASDQGGESDGGVSRRILGTLLTWLSERSKPVFIVATANDISQLPPELIRKGRFDEIFFVDLPNPAARQAIFSIHLQRRQHVVTAFNLAALVTLSDGFSGAEIEQAIIAAGFEAAVQQSDMTQQHLETEIRRTRPLSVVMAEKMAALRSWAQGRAVSAD